MQAEHSSTGQTTFWASAWRPTHDPPGTYWELSAIYYAAAHIGESKRNGWQFWIICSPFLVLHSSASQYQVAWLHSPKWRIGSCALHIFWTRQQLLHSWIWKAESNGFFDPRKHKTRGQALISKIKFMPRAQILCHHIPVQGNELVLLSLQVPIAQYVGIWSTLTAWFNCNLSTPDKHICDVGGALFARDLYAEVLSLILQFARLRQPLIAVLCIQSRCFDYSNPGQDWVLPALKDLLGIVLGVELENKDR